MKNENELIIEQNKLTTLFFAVSSIALACFGIYLYEIESDPELVFWTYYVTTPPCIITAIFLFRKLFTNEPILKINKKGIYDKSTLVNPNFISWENINSIYIGQIYGHEFLYIEIIDSNLVLKKQPLWKKILIKANLWYSDNALAIATNLILLNSQEILYLISKIIVHHKIENFDIVKDKNGVLLYIERLELE